MAEEESLIVILRKITHKYKEVGSNAANFGKFNQWEDMN